MNPKYEVLAIGGSAGSLSMLLTLLPHLVPTLNIALVVVLHRKDSEDNTLVDVLRHRTMFAVKEAEDKETIETNTIYVAPTDYHLLVEKDHSFSLDNSEKVNYSRPSIDVTFESLADVYGPTVVGLLLSGANADGVDGLKAIKKAGGGIVVQDPAASVVPYMPQQALNALPADMLLHEHSLERFIQYLADKSQ
ncbi:chemotaxis protein CheB [Chryseolinea lacunae]|uniref:protein-glutamate methylesterase n=1 Tax=Chryseolinea lacunae TaxID=2801331 RepID=A0ABS1L0U6_9BACT|nr:chemotaxis protein CheB [Chryseolinea lacunae]MBL0745314.1 chemotaxis protein CheB [Chryseolinea lacunae]